MTATNDDAKYFLLVKDVVSNTEYIFSDQTVTKQSLARAFSNCFQQLRLTRQKLQMNSHEMYCECFETVDCLNAGWVYNYTSTKTQVCYIIRAIEVITTNESPCLDKPDTNKTTKKIEAVTTPFVDEYISDMVNELKYRLSQPNFGLKS